jgi:hypothetical protein
MCSVNPIPMLFPILILFSIILLALAIPDQSQNLNFDFNLNRNVISNSGCNHISGCNHMINLVRVAFMVQSGLTKCLRLQSIPASCWALHSIVLLNTQLVHWSS